MTADELLAEFRSAVPFPDEVTTASALNRAIAPTARARSRRRWQLVSVSIVLFAALVSAAVRPRGRRVPKAETVVLRLRRQRWRRRDP